MAALLEHANGENVGTLVKLESNEMLIGRMDDCDLVTEPRFTSVSQRHAVLRRTPEGWTIVDVGTRGQGSSYGTYINGIRLTPNRQATLHPEDEIRLGTKLGKYFKFHGEGTDPFSQPVSLKGRLIVDVGKRHVLLDGRVVAISLTPQEFDFLRVLWHKSGSVCLFKEISKELWPDEELLASPSIDGDLRVRVNTLAHSLRRKLKSALDDVDVLESSRGVGYRIRM